MKNKRRRKSKTKEKNEKILKWKLKMNKEKLEMNANWMKERKRSINIKAFMKIIPHKILHPKTSLTCSALNNTYNKITFTLFTHEKKVI